MKVRNAKLGDVQVISELLSIYYKELNNSYGVERFKTDVTLMQKHLINRIGDEKSEFKYFVLEDESQEILGFVNILIKEVPELIILSVINGIDKKLATSTLLNYIIEYIRALGYKSLMSEISAIDPEVEESLSAIGMKIVEYRGITHI